MQIRTAQTEDAAAIASVHVAAWRATYQGILPAQFLAELAVEKRELFWRETLANPAAQKLVCVAETEQKEIVGFTSGGPERSGDREYPGEIYAIYLLAAHQRQGVGRQLATALAARLIEQGVSAILVWVLAANPAREFYRALGGQPARERVIGIAGLKLAELAYGWKDARLLAPPGI